MKNPDYWELKIYLKQVYVRKMEITILPWNGTCLNEFSSVEIQEEIRIATLTYWQVLISLDESTETHWVIRRQINNKLPIVSEQMKSFLGLPSRGCHSFIYRGKDYILIPARSPYEGGELTLSTALKNDPGLKDNLDLRRKVRQIYTFRQILSMSESNDSKLVLRRRSDNEIVVYSLIDNFERNLNNYSNSGKVFKTLSQAVFDRWFSDIHGKTIDLVQCMCNLLDVLSISQKDLYMERIFDFLEELNRIIICFDESLIWYTSIVEERLRSTI